MNPERLLQHFDRISEAPDAIPRLRRFILDLAVRGKLVEQDPNDEPAEELLKRIQGEKARLLKEGKLRRKQPLQPVNDVTLPFVVPRHWTWLQLCEIGTLSGGMTPSKNRSDYWDGEINWFSPKDIKSDKLVESELKITSTGVAETGLQLYPVGCLFMVARSGILKRSFPVSINCVEATVNQDLKVLTPFIKGVERYLQIMFQGMTDFILSALVKTGTTVQSLKYEEFELQPLPFPPLAEQHRIIIKVDELMTLCDQLEAAKTEREQSRDRLVAASLHRLNSPADTAETDAPDLPARQADAFRDHARFVFHHLPRLTTRPEHIKQLRQTILNLAVRGKLVKPRQHIRYLRGYFRRLCLG
jgi:type I restriction enzyme S subunit